MHGLDKNPEDKLKGLIEHFKVQRCLRTSSQRGWVEPRPFGGGVEVWFKTTCTYVFKVWAIRTIIDPDRAPLKEVLGGQYNYREGGRQVLRQGAKGRRRSRKCEM